MMSLHVGVCCTFGVCEGEVSRSLVSMADSRSMQGMKWAEDPIFDCELLHGFASINLPASLQ